MKTIADITFEVGEIDNVINWTVSDLDIGTFTIYQNGTEISSEDWTDNFVVNFSVDSYTAGIYNFTIVAEDLSGNIASET